MPGRKAFDNLPYQYRVKERGGPVNKWLLVALLIAGLASAAMNVYLMRHRSIVVNYTSQPVAPKAHTDEVGRVHIFPDDGWDGACVTLGHFCWTKT